jgi:glycerol-3-phosphate dehydrogenase
MVPHTDDGRVLFVIPWRERVLVGTTDTAIDRMDAEPVPFTHEIDFLWSMPDAISRTILRGAMCCPPLREFARS